MLPMYADKCWGEGDMHDTAMLLGLLGWDDYAAPVEIVTPYFGSSGTGQINAIFPVTPLADRHRPNWNLTPIRSCPIMPHLVILYTPNLEAQTDMPALCRDARRHACSRSATRRASRCIPTGGTRVLAYPAAHYAVADGKGDYGFVLPQRAHGRGPQRGGEERAPATRCWPWCKPHFAPVFEQQHVGITLQIDESPGQVYDGKHSNLHPLFNK